MTDQHALVVDGNRAFFLGPVIGVFVFKVPLFRCRIAGNETAIEFNADAGVAHQVTNLLDGRHQLQIVERFVPDALDGATRCAVFKIVQLVVVAHRAGVNGHLPIVGSPTCFGVRHDLAPAQAEPAISGITFLVRCAKASEVTQHVIAAGKSATVISAVKTLFGHGQAQCGGIGVYRVHHQLNDGLADRSGLTMDDVLNDFGVQLER
ncbi:hypothetical protein ALO53_200186 [Pseudomonas amygdali pv. photiniae]|uniref:Uncharacterized protein n=1 Tax=Pseudomonas amygdali pv. photiniae TaxID=251724 RepID=A0A0P9XSL6_PSEA0|nr:hypothetical protein ALO53_200186 [Pseudomonas amygdali pv. photiniae]